MQTLTEIKTLLEERALHPRRHLGQHFLIDHNLLRRLVSAAAIAPGELVLEVGAGTGTLTEALLEAGAVVVASEIDRDLAEILRERLGAAVTLVEGDCLAKGRRLSDDLVKALEGRPFKLVANLPYQAASTLIASLLIGHPECRGQFVTIQREVAERLMAPPHTKAYGALTVLVQAMAEVETIARLRPTCFWPLPNVESAMFAIRPRPGRGGIRDPAALMAFTTALFSKRRKQLGTIFGRDRQWPAGIDATTRPDALSVEQIVSLWESSPKAPV